MKIHQYKENNKILSTKGTQIYNENNIPTINFNNKLLSLPLINKNIVFSDRSPINTYKKSLEGFKPIEDIKTRTKLDTNNINKSLKIKYLSLNQNKSKDNILLLMDKKNNIKSRFIKYRNNLINDELFNGTSKKRRLILLNKFFTELKNNKLNNNKKKNFHIFSKTPKKIKQILINDILSFNSLDSNFENKNNKIINTENINYPSVRTEIEKKERNNHKLIIHNIFFDWIMNNIITKNFDEKKELNRSYDLLINMEKSNKKIKRMNNKKIKSADFSRNDNLKIKEAFIFDKNDEEKYYKNKMKNKFFDIFRNFKFINKDNIDENYINVNTFQNIFNIISKKVNINKKYIKKHETTNNYNYINNDNSESDTDSEIIEKNKKEILSLKNGNHFLGKFINKLLTNYNIHKDKEIIYNNDNKENIIDNSFLYKRYIEPKKKEQKEKEKHKEINKINKVNKSLKLNKKLNISLLNEKINLHENGIINKSKDNYNLFAYRNKKAINNNICLTSAKKKNKIERNDNNKNYFNIVTITSPEQIIKEKKTIYVINNPTEKEINNDLENQDKNFIKSKNNTVFYQMINKIKTNSVSNIGETVLENYSSEKNILNNNNINNNNNNTNNNINNNYNYNNKFRNNPEDNKKYSNRNTGNNKSYNDEEVENYKENIINSPNDIIKYKTTDKKMNDNNNEYVHSNSNNKKKENDIIYNKEELKFQKYNTIKKNENNTRKINFNNVNNYNNELENIKQKKVLDNIKKPKNIIIIKDDIKNKIIKKNNKNNIYNNDIKDNNNEKENYNINDNIKEENYNPYEEEEYNNEEIYEKEKKDSKVFEELNNNFDINEEIQNYKENKAYNLINDLNFSPKEQKDIVKNDLKNENYKPKNNMKKYPTIIMSSIKKEKANKENKNKRRITNIISSISSEKGKPITNDIKDINNISSIKKEKNNLIIIKNQDNNKNQENIFANLEDDDDILESIIQKNSKPLGKIKNDLELEKIIFNKNSKGKAKTNRRISKNFLKYYKEEKEEEEEEEEEIEFIKVTKKKKKAIKHINSLINSLKNIDEDFSNNKEFNLSGTNSLNAEDMKKLIIYSTKLRQISELDESSKTEELIQMEKDIKEEYNAILNKYLMKQKYKDLTKKKDIKINKKKLKILYEETNEDENETEIEMKLKIKERKKKPENKSNYIRMKIEDSEEEPEKEEENQVQQKEEKKLIFDNSYLFNKNKKDNIIIKQEVLDILNGKQNSNNDNNENITPSQTNDNENDNKDKISTIGSRKRKTFMKNLNATRRATQIHFQQIKKARKKVKPKDIYKLALFSDIKEEIKEKVETEEDKREKLLDLKLEMFFKEIQRIKKYGGNFDIFDFLKSDETKDKEYMNRLTDFSDNINSFRIRDKRYHSKFNFLSPIKFKINKLEE